MELGFHHEYGRGVRKDVKRAGELYRKGCDGGNAIGCSNLGMCYRLARCGLPKNTRRAVELYKKACDGGFKKACGYWEKYR